ncbi:MAG: hypothetical protein M1828_005841 [Chrysothrix sp. TS-e1954]|nr:MAG: hypothetical protein M1828_005841 [Chrysothrix sp. TS-e1954]
MDHFKRSSLAGLAGKRDKKSSPAPSPSLKPTIPQDKLDIVIESPPNLMLNNPAQSSGVVLSGQLRIGVITAPEIVLESFSMQLLATVTCKKPVVKDCPDCTRKTTELHRWKFLSEPKTLAAGEHKFPFSHLIPGHLPATTFGRLGVLTYGLSAQAKTRDGQVLSLERPLDLARAVPPLPEKNCMRIFPPTNITAALTCEPVIHPIGRFSVLMRVSGVSDSKETMPGSGKRDLHHRWRLRKLNWRLEETESMISPACTKHADKVGGEGKGVKHEEVRTLSHADFKEGWKTDFDVGDIDFEFAVSPNQNPRPLCDVESPTGLKISHNVVIEFVVAEEWARGTTKQVTTPTGAARVLKCQFQVMITERAGMGISWDEEQPPMYEDVPASPPLYSVNSEMRDYEGPPLEDPPEGYNLGNVTPPSPGPSSTPQG